MGLAFTYLKYIYEKFLDFVFNLEFLTGAYLGWVLVSVFLVGVMIRSIIALPRSAGRIRIKGDE